MIPTGKAVLLVRLAADILAGDKSDAVAVARELMALAVDMIPVDELRGFLTERDRVFADLAADAAEDIKLDATKGQ